jgi:hypothetical protein
VATLLRFLERLLRRGLRISMMRAFLNRPRIPSI